MSPPIITLLTDFGQRDPFVGAMKGVILGICPDARLVDLTHDVERQGIREGALALESAAPFFPAGAIHLAVVDPGVGTARRGLAVRAQGQYFVGPDNGLLSAAFAGPWAAVSLENAAFRLPRVSRTFHGRDLFAPAAAHLAAGVPLTALGPAVADPVRLSWPGWRVEDGQLEGEVIAVDRFGNLVTNLTAAALDALGPPGDVRLSAAGVGLGGIVSAYAEGGTGVPAAIVGSTGRLEIFVRDGSAAALLSLGLGAPVQIRRAC